MFDLTNSWLEEVFGKSSAFSRLAPTAFNSSPKTGTSEVGTTHSGTTKVLANKSETQTGTNQQNFGRN